MYLQGYMVSHLEHFWNEHHWDEEIIFRSELRTFCGAFLLQRAAAAVDGLLGDGG